MSNSNLTKAPCQRTATPKVSPRQVKEILNAIHSITGDNQVLRDNGEEIIFHNPHEQPIKEGCPFSVPIQYVEDYREPKVRKRKDPAKVYEELHICASTGLIPNKVLKYTAKKWVESTPVVCAIINGEKRFFEGRAKSSARYNSFYYWKIHDHAKKLHELGYKSYFLTVTNDPKPYRHDYIEAWKGFHSNVNRLLKNFCRKFHALYECVYEAQKTGNPHAHIVLWLPHFYEDDVITKGKNKVFISGGTLKRYLKKYEAGAGFMELRRGEDKDPINYLLKYISKATTRDFYTMVKDKNRLKDSDRKDLLSAMLPIISRVRQFSMSQGVLEEKEEESKEPSTHEDENQTPKAFESQSEAKAYLKTLCTNFPLPCQSRVRFFTFKMLSQGTTIAPKDLSKLSDERKEKLYKEGRCFGCKGCIITHFLNEIKNGNDEFFTIKTDDSEELQSKTVEEDGLLAQIYEEQEAPAEISQKLASSEEDLPHLSPIRLAIAQEKDAREEKEAIKNKIRADIIANQNLIGYSLQTNLEAFSINKVPECKTWKFGKKDDKGFKRDALILSDETFNELKKGTSIRVYADVDVTRFTALFDYELSVGITQMQNELSDERIFAELHIVDRDKIYIDNKNTKIIAIDLNPTEKTLDSNFKGTIRVYKNDDLTD